MARTAPPTFPRSSLSARFRASIPFYLIALPGVLYILVYHYLPMFGIVIAFKDVSPFATVQDVLRRPFVGFRWFKQFFNSYYFWQILGNTVWIRVLMIVWGFPLPILLALSLNEVRGSGYKRTIQTISYVPHFFSSVVVAGIVMSFLSTDGGFLNTVLSWFGRDPHLFLGDRRFFRPMLVITHIWQGTGWGSILYLAAMSGIDPGLYESAVLDGAGRFRRMWNITLPGISGIVVLLLIFQIGQLLNAGFELIFLLYSEPVYEVADIIDTYVYRVGLMGMQYSFATAVGFFKSVVAMMLLFSADFMAKRLGHSGIF